jgi:hybrid cluster-associated redox disulfide protein
VSTARLRWRKDAAGPMRDPVVVTSANILHMLVADVLAASPATAQVFVEHRMGCVGCPFTRFETVAEVARVYAIPPRDLANSLADASTPKDVRQ